MDSSEVHALIASRLSARLERMGMSANDLTDDLDLVRSGLLDSLGFVDLMAALENSTGKRIDLERALDVNGATTLKNVIALFA